MSVTPAMLSSSHSPVSSGPTVLVVTNTYDYTSTQTPIPGSLRYEVAIADTLTNSVIDFNLPTSRGSSAPPVIVLSGGPLVIDCNVTINGLTTSGCASSSQYGGSSWMPGCGIVAPKTGVIITQNNTAVDCTLFDITAGVVQLNGLTLLGGAAGPTGFGGAVFDSDVSSVTFQNDVFTSNTAGAGGAIAAIPGAGAMAINCCSFSFNTASFGGAVVYAGTSTLCVSNSQFTQNTANDALGEEGAIGGAIAVIDGVTGTQLSVSCSTFCGNVAIGLAGSSANPDGDGGYGGAIGVINTTGEGGVLTGVGSTVITSCTFSSNAAVGGAGANGTLDNGAGNGGAGIGGAIMTTGNLTISGKSTFNLNGAVGGAGGNGDTDDGGDGGNGGDAFGGAVAAFGAAVGVSVGRGSYSASGYHESFQFTSGGSYSGKSSSRSTCCISGTVTFSSNRAIGGAGGMGEGESDDDTEPGVSPDQVDVNGGNGGNADGGAVAVAFGTFSGVSFAGNSVLGGAGGAGAMAVDGFDAGDGGAGGDAVGGALYAYGGLIVSCTNFNANIAQGGAGGNGGTGGDVGDPGTGASGGDAGGAEGGAVFIGAPIGLDGLIPEGTLPVTNGASTFTNSNFTCNIARGGVGGLYGDASGTNGEGGDAEGGALANEGTSTVTISGQCGGASWSSWGKSGASGSFSGNEAIGGASVGIGGFGGEGLGGGIYNDGTMVVTGQQFSNNQAIGGAGTEEGGDGGGGGIYDAEALTLTHSQFTGNAATGGVSSGTAGDGYGGALGLGGPIGMASAQVVDVVFSCNTAAGGASASGTTAGDGAGGAIAVLESGDVLNLISCQLTKNVAIGGAGIPGTGTQGGSGLGGGLYNAGSTTVTSTSITSNKAVAGSPGGTGFGGGIYKNGGTLILSANSKVTGNTATTADPNTN